MTVSRLNAEQCRALSLLATAWMLEAYRMPADAPL
jgi:hypothetical protein